MNDEYGLYEIIINNNLFSCVIKSNSIEIDSILCCSTYRTKLCV